MIAHYFRWLDRSYFVRARNHINYHAPGEFCFRFLMPGTCRKHSMVDAEKKKDTSPSESRRAKKEKGSPLTIHWLEGEGEAAVVLLAEHFSIPEAHATIVVQACRRLLPENSAIFASYASADRIHQALSLPGPGRPCEPGVDAEASFQNLKAWFRSKLPVGEGTKAKLISAGENGDAFSNLSQDEFLQVSPQITFQPEDFAWLVAVRSHRFSCGGVLVMTGTGVGQATIGKYPSTFFFDE